MGVSAVGRRWVTTSAAGSQWTRCGIARLRRRSTQEAELSAPPESQVLCARTGSRHTFAVADNTDSGIVSSFVYV